MSQATYSWQKIVNLLVLLFKDRRLQKAGKWLCYCLIVAILWWFNWKLFLATVVGIGLMVGCYLWQNPHWQSYCQKWQKFLAGSNRQLALAVAIGAVGAFCTYLAASIWSETENQWLATGAILQSFASLTTLVVLLRSVWQKPDCTADTKLESYLEHLSHNDSLKRLIAIRQITRMLINRRLSAELYTQSIEYFYFMLSEPQLPAIRNALLESLEILDSQQLSRSKSAVKIPIQLKQTRKPIKILHN